MKVVGSTKVKMSAFNIKRRIPGIVYFGPLSYSDEVTGSFERLVQIYAPRPNKKSVVNGPGVPRGSKSQMSAGPAPTVWSKPA
jgi:hypothetical protein